MTRVMRRYRFPAAVVVAVFVASLSLAACTRAVDGHGVYATETSSGNLPLVKIDELPDLILPPSEAGPVIDAPGLTSLVTYSAVNPVPNGLLSDMKCVGVMAPGAESSYRGSGYQGIYGSMFQDHGQPRLTQTTIAFGGGDDAQAFVNTATSRWKDCASKTLTVNIDQPPANWTVSGPHRSDGVTVLLRRLEGGQGVACSRAMAARSNIVADVLVIGTDDADLEHQGATIANMMLAKIPE